MTLETWSVSCNTCL